MSIPRVYRIAKAYLNEWQDRLETLDRELAERELRQGTEPGAYARNDASPDAMMRRAEERIAAARGQKAAGVELARSSSSPVAPAVTDPDQVHYRVLGVESGADWSSVQSAYEKLARRCDVRRFPDGSEEQKAAAAILERVNVSYEALRKKLDPTESRFGKLEF